MLEKEEEEGPGSEAGGGGGPLTAAEKRALAAEEAARESVREEIKRNQTMLALNGTEGEDADLDVEVSGVAWRAVPCRAVPWRMAWRGVAYGVAWRGVVMLSPGC